MYEAGYPITERGQRSISISNGPTSYDLALGRKGRNGMHETVCQAARGRDACLLACLLLACLSAWERLETECPCRYLRHRGRPRWRRRSGKRPPCALRGCEAKLKCGLFDTGSRRRGRGAGYRAPHHDPPPSTPPESAPAGKVGRGRTCGGRPIILVPFPELVCYVLGAGCWYCVPSY